MKLYFHYCSAGFSNCYVLGSDSGGEAVIIDPGNMDLSILGLIEDNNYTLKGILVTHDHPHHTQGVKTILRIYNTEIFAINPSVQEQKTTLVHDGDIVSAGPFKVEVISIPGHSADSAVFKIDRLLFTGDVLSAGFLGNTASSYAAAAQVNALRGKIFALPGDYTVLPGHGPPSSLEAERRFNLDLNSPKSGKNRRPVFRVEF